MSILHVNVILTTPLSVNETKRKLENLRSYFRRETKKLQDHERKTGEKLVSRYAETGKPDFLKVL